jgi:hypothetical protein
MTGIMQSGERFAEDRKRELAEEEERLYNAMGDGKRPPLKDAPEHVQERIRKQAAENIAALHKSRMERAFSR